MGLFVWSLAQIGGIVEELKELPHKRKVAELWRDANETIDRLAREEDERKRSWETAPPLPTPEQVLAEIKRAVTIRYDAPEIPLLSCLCVGSKEFNFLNDPRIHSDHARSAYQRYTQACVDVIRTYQRLRPPPTHTGAFFYEHIYSEEEQLAVATELRDAFQVHFPKWPNARPDIPERLNIDEYKKSDGEVSWTRYEAAEDRRQKEIDSTWDDLEPLQRTLADTPLYWRYEDALPKSQQRPLPLKAEQRYQGMWIIAPPGRGKTNLLWQLVDRDLQTDEKTIILMDSKGTFIKEFRDYPGAVVLTKDNIRVNPFSFGTDVLSVEFAEYLLSTLVNVEMTQLQRTMFSSVVEVLLHIPNATLETFHDILSEGIDNYKAAVEKCNPITKAFFLKGKVPDWNNEQSQRTKGEVRARLRTLLRYEYMRTIFLAKRNSHDFLGLLSSRRLIIIDNSKDDLGEQGSEFLGRFFIALIRMEGVKRTKLKRSDRVPVYLYIDEAQNVIATDRKLRSIIQECRDQNIALTIAHQYIDDISTEVRPALYNCAVRIANADEEAPEIAPRLNATVEEVKLPAHNFCVYVRDATPKPVRIHLDFLDLDAIPKGPPYIPPTPEEPQEEYYAPEPEDRPHSTIRTKDDF